MRHLRMTNPRFSRVRGTLVVGAALVALLALFAPAPVWAAECEDCGGGDQGGGGGPGEGVSLPVPDAAFQFKGPLLGCLPASVLDYLEKKITEKITEALKRAGEADPKPEMRAACGGGRQTVAVWFKRVGEYGAQDTDAARDAEVQKVDILTGTETAAVLITATGVDRQVGAQFEKRRHMDTAGKPNTAGPIHLTRYELKFLQGISPGPATPRFIVTGIDGYFEVDVLPDVDFDVQTIDTLWLSGGKVQCDSETEKDIHTGVLDVLQFLTILLGQYVSPNSVFLLEGFIIFDNNDDLPAEDGPGCVLASAIPSEIMIPGAKYVEVGGFHLRVAYKLDMHYARLDVNANGITSAGTFTQVVRRPSLEIVGPSNPIRIEFESGQASATFRLRTQDLRDVKFRTDLFQGNPKVTWNAPGATISHPFYCAERNAAGDCTELKLDWQRATISWPIDPLTPVGTRLNRSFGVQVIDDDGLTAKASRLVRFEITRDPNLPPLCDKHPERFECDPER